jgi:hypothetical protein
MLPGRRNDALTLRDLLLEILQAQVELIVRQPLRTPSEARPLQLANDCPQPVVLVRRRVPLGAQAQHQRLQALDIARQLGRDTHSDSESHRHGHE